MMRELAKAYDPKLVEKPTYERWERSGYFTPEKLPRAKGRKPFVIAMPPPNVTGELHMGHALGMTIEDILIRHRRMAGFRTLWVPGTDHAGIATQVMVERLLAEGGIDRQEIGREVFLKHVWTWKEKYGDRITKQIRSLGASCDWSREHFTMDPGLTLAVQTAFVRLYNDGLIYRGERIINWCPRDRTALSDLEVRYVEQKGKLYHLRYPLTGTTKYVTVATTRPETMLGDAAVAVHPHDKRYRQLVGKTVILPIVEREISIIADRRVDPNFGTGAVKVTPGHDKLDHAIGRQHKLPTHTIIDERGKMTKEAGEFYGLSTQACREAIVQRLEEAGQIEQVVEHVHSVATCDRCGYAIEPRVSLQWFVHTQPLAKPAIEAVRKGRIRIVPERFAKVYFHWLENVEDWCISRQLWWGHRIPIWYCEEQRKGPKKPCAPIAAIKAPIRCPHCGGKKLKVDEDTLDTWFSSGLWTFSTLGWPKRTHDLAAYHPTDVMETGWDILFFWVARMTMMSLYLLKQVPFRTVYLHGLVLDREGKKMSKSKGTGIDPIPMTEKYGTDAIRLSLVIGTAAGQDAKLWEDKIAFQRNFVNKLWNVGRYVLSRQVSGKKVAAKTLADRWILSRLQTVVQQTTNDLEAYQFSEAGLRLQDFLWHELADWYVEVEKAQPNPAVLRLVFATLLKLLHPFTPYVTEVLWLKLTTKQGKTALLMIQEWPKADRRFIDAASEKQFALLQELVAVIRNVRAYEKLSPQQLLPMSIAGLKAKLIAENEAVVKTLGRLERIEVVASMVKPSGAVNGVQFSLTLPAGSDESRTKAEMNLTDYIAKIEAKLANPNFRQRAPKAVVSEEERKLAEARERLAQLTRKG